MKRHCLWSIVLSCYLSLTVSAAEVPLLIVEGPSHLSAITERLRHADPGRVQFIMKFLGIEVPGKPIRVIVASEQSDWTAQVPEWVSGYAIPQQDLVVILPDRVIGYPYDSIESLFSHEIAHILIRRAAGGQAVPRWLDEGLAMVAARSWDFEDRARLVWALVIGQPVTLDELAELFRQDRSSAHQAYVLAHALVRYGLHQFGDEWPKRLLASLATGSTFEKAFFQTTSLSLEQFQADFWDHQTVWIQWVPVLTSSIALWMGILGLALYVFKKQRQRAEAVKRQWKEDDDWPA